MVQYWPRVSGPNNAARGLLYIKRCFPRLIDVLVRISFQLRDILPVHFQTCKGVIITIVNKLNWSICGPYVVGNMVSSYTFGIIIVSSIILL